MNSKTFDDVAIYETRKTQDPVNPSGYHTVKRRGWWVRSGLLNTPDVWLGANRAEAQERASIEYGRALNLPA